MPVTPQEKELYDEVKQDPKAYEMLRNKSSWEQMSHYAVLSEWGDPRGWCDYIDGAKD